MKKLLFLTILLISNGLLGMDKDGKEFLKELSLSISSLALKEDAKKYQSFDLSKLSEVKLIKCPYSKTYLASLDDGSSVQACHFFDGPAKGEISCNRIVSGCMVPLSDDILKKMQSLYETQEK